MWSHNTWKELLKVRLLAGWTYERSAIATWLLSHDSSPMTNARMPNKALIANKSMRALVQVIDSLKDL